MTTSTVGGFYGTPEQLEAIRRHVRAEHALADAKRNLREATSDLRKYGISWHPDKGYGIKDLWYQGGPS